MCDYTAEGFALQCFIYIQYWEADEPQEDTEQEEVVSELQPVFPEAIPGQEILHSTPSEITPSLPSTGSVDRDPSVQQTPSESRYTNTHVIVFPSACLVFKNGDSQGQGASQDQTPGSLADPQKARGDASWD